jgi:hypothetical protein
VTVRSKACICRRLLAGIVVSNAVGAWRSASCEFCALSGGGFGIGLIARPEKSYRMYGVSECDREASIMRRPWPTRGCCATEIEIKESSAKVDIARMQTRRMLRNL